MIYNPGQLRRDSSLYTSQARKPIRLAYLLYKKTIDIDQHLAQKVIVDIPKFKEIKILQESYFNHTDLTRSFRLLKLLKRGLTDIHKNQLYEILLLTKLTNSFSVAARNSITILTYTDYELIDKDIENIILSNVDLGHLCMINSSFKNSSLNIVNFSNSQLFRLNFQNCDLENA